MNFHTKCIHRYHYPTSSQSGKKTEPYLSIAYVLAEAARVAVAELMPGEHGAGEVPVLGRVGDHSAHFSLVLQSYLRRCESILKSIQIIVLYF